jgi:hypothetical protein
VAIWLLAVLAAIAPEQTVDASTDPRRLAQGPTLAEDVLTALLPLTPLQRVAFLLLERRRRERAADELMSVLQLVARGKLTDASLAAFPSLAKTLDSLSPTDRSKLFARSRQPTKGTSSPNR